MSSLLDENTMQLIISNSGIIHVKAWFSKTVCGKNCWDIHKWEFGGLISLRRVAKMAQVPQANRFCKSCARIYKDVNVNG
jgi:hypothetical protein